MTGHRSESTRRALLAAGVGVLTAVAGCGGLRGGEEDDDVGYRITDEDTPYPDPTETETTVSAEGPIDPIATAVPSFQYDARNSGVADAAPGSEPVPVLRAGIDGAIRSPPALADGVVFLGSVNGVLRAVATETGETLWSKSASGATFSGTRRTPTVADGRVYYTTSLGTMVARTTDGKHLWTFEADAPVHPSSPDDAERIYGSNPVVGDGRVYVNAGDGIYGIDARNGAVRWKVPVVETAPNSPAYADGAVYYGRVDGYLVAADAETGDPLWSYDAGYGVSLESPTVADGVVYAAAYDGGEEGKRSVFAVDAADGAELWTYDVEKGVAESVSVADGSVFVPGRAGTLHALNADDGSRLWRRSLGETASATGAATVVGDTVYVAANVHGREPPRLFGIGTDGTERWVVDLEMTPETGPIVADGRILLVADRRMVVYG